MKPADVRGLYEEIANAVSHAIGLGLAAAGWSALLVRSVDSGDPWRLAAAVIFGTCMLSMYAFSVLYHGYQIQPLKHYFRVFDHITIYFVIVGTFTPVPLVFDRSPYGWTILGIVWAMALLGIVYKVFFFGRSELESVGTYVLMSAVAFFESASLTQYPRVKKHLKGFHLQRPSRSRIPMLEEVVAVGRIKPVVVVLVGIKIVSTVRHQVVADLH